MKRISVVALLLTLLLSSTMTIALAEGNGGMMGSGLAAAEGANTIGSGLAVDDGGGMMGSGTGG